MHWPAIAAVALAIAFGVLNGSFHSEHLFTDRDPAVYLNTARSIARTHELKPKVELGPFAESAFSPSSAGFGARQGRLNPNFFHLLPVLLSLGASAGGDVGLLVMPAVLGALGLLAIYALAATIVGPRWALLPPMVLAAGSLQAWFARDAYSELVMQFLALGALWLLIDSFRRGAVLRGGIAGAVLGVTTMARIDAFTMFIGLPMALVVMALRPADEHQPQRSRRTVLAFAAGVIATSVLGHFVSRALSLGYQLTLWENVRSSLLATLASAALALIAGLLIRARRDMFDKVVSSRLIVAAVVVPLTAFATWVYFIRPAPASEQPKLVPGAPISGQLRRMYDSFNWSYSARWFEWYLGPLLLTIAVVGVGILVVRAIRGSNASMVLAAVAVPILILYIVRPSISPDHYWAMRRYLPVVLPLLAIAAAVTSATIVDFLGRLVSAPMRVGVASLLVAAILVPAGIDGARLPRARMQGGSLDEMHELCAAAGPRSAIAIVRSDYLDLTLPQTIRSFCGVPAASITDLRREVLDDAAREWKRNGRELLVASARTQPVLQLVPDARQIARFSITDRYEPDRRTDDRPRDYVPRPITISLYQLPAPAG